MQTVRALGLERRRHPAVRPIRRRRPALRGRPSRLSRSAWAISYSPVEKSPRWPCSMRWRGLQPGVLGDADSHRAGQFQPGTGRRPARLPALHTARSAWHRVCRCARGAAVGPPCQGGTMAARPEPIADPAPDRPELIVPARCGRVPERNRMKRVWRDGSRSGGREFRGLIGTSQSRYTPRLSDPLSGRVPPCARDALCVMSTLART
jgi:hypothetical protein